MTGLLAEETMALAEQAARRVLAASVEGDLFADATGDSEATRTLHAGGHGCVEPGSGAAMHSAGAVSGVGQKTGNREQKPCWFQSRHEFPGIKSETWGTRILESFKSSRRAAMGSMDMARRAANSKSRGLRMRARCPRRHRLSDPTR